MTKIEIQMLRLDILPEEVALRYGYDAQRKVVNIILRRRFQSRVANLSGGFATAGQNKDLSGDVTARGSGAAAMGIEFLDGAARTETARAAARVPPTRRAPGRGARDARTAGRRRGPARAAAWRRRRISA